MNELLKLVKTSRGVTSKAQSVKPGSIFVAIKGNITDGNLYAHIAESKGALAIVSDHPQNLPQLNIPVFQVENARHALSSLAANYYGNPSENMSVIGVTGTNGKTTITFMLQHIFKHYGYNTGLIGTIYTDIGKAIYPSTLTTPEPDTLHYALKQMLAGNIKYAVMEVSAQAIEMHRTDHLHLSCGILSNICPDHLDFHFTYDNYIAAKKKFLNLLSLQAPLIVNISDNICKEIAAGKNSNVITVSLNGEDAVFQAEIKQIMPYYSSFLIHLTAPIKNSSGDYIYPNSFEVTLPLPGIHNIENALLSAACAVWHKIDTDVISKALSSFSSVPRRMNIHNFHDFTVIDDTALNPGSIDAVFSCLKNLNYHQLTVINAIRGNRGVAINQVNACTLSKWQQYMPFRLIVTASSGMVDELNMVTDEEKRAFLSSLNQTKARYTYTDDLVSAVNIAIQNTNPGDILILLGAQGMDRGFEILNTQINAYKTTTKNFAALH